MRTTFTITVSADHDREDLFEDLDRDCSEVIAQTLDKLFVKGFGFTDTNVFVWSEGAIEIEDPEDNHPDTI